MVNEMIYPHVAKYYNEKFRSYVMKAHFHDEDEVMYVVSGECYTPCYDKESDTWDEITLKEGMYIHIPGGMLHDFKIREGFPCHVMNVEYSCEDKSKRPYTIVRDDGSMLKIFQVLQDKLHDGSMGKYPDDETRERDIGLAVMLLESKIELQKMSSPKHESEAERYVDSALRYIQENYTDEIAVQDIASHIGIAPAYLQRLFRAHTGSTITEYITRLRLNRSKYLLTHSELSIVDVAINAGFGSRQRLSQVFAAEEHTSPKQYRMNNKE